MKIIKTKNSIELDKRQHVPFRIEDACPKCHHIEKRDLSHGQGAEGQYLSYPETSKPTTLYMCCTKCEHNWQRRVIVDITLVLKR